MVTPATKHETTALVARTGHGCADKDDSRDESPAGEQLLEEAARGFVHWVQALAQLSRHFPFDDVAAQRLRYAKKLAEIHGLDPRVEMVFDPDIRLLYTVNGWVDADSRQPQKFVKRTVARLPAVCDAQFTPKGWSVASNECRVERALSNIPLPGYQPIRNVRGISFSRNPDIVEIPFPHAGAPVALLNGDSLPSETAFARLIDDFPGLSQQYVKTALAAAICASTSAGPPPIVLVTGPSGAGKDQSLHLAASMLADQVQDATLGGEEAHWRRIAGYCEAGHRFIHVPEMAREENPGRLLKYLLKTNETITQRRLFNDQDCQTSNSAALFLTGISIPPEFRRSAEVRRRVRLVQLNRKVPIDWEVSLKRKYGREVNAADWRSLSNQNALVANSILTHVHGLCERHCFQFSAVADELDLLTIDEEGTEVQEELCRALYRHCRNETPGRRIVDGGHWDERHCWIDASTPACWPIIEALADGDEDLRKPKGRKSLLYRLRSLDWLTILGIRDPIICIETQMHGKVIGLRFRDASKMKKGDGVFNENLPPIWGGEGR